MKDQFVSFEIAIALKELGFAQEGFAEYQEDFAKKPQLEIYQDEDYSFYSEVAPVVLAIAPLWQQAIDFLRESYDVDIELPSGGSKGKYYVFVQDYIYEGKDPKQFDYKDAREAAILKAIDLKLN